MWSSMYNKVCCTKPEDLLAALLGGGGKGGN